MFALAKTDRTPECVSAARRLLPRLAGSPSSATVAAYGLDCAIELEAAAPERAAAIAEFEKAVAAGLQDTKLGLSADDRSGLYASLISAREDAKDAEGERRLEKEWVAMLEEAAAKAPNPEARAVFDSHRLSAYLEIGEPQRAVDMLLQSERDFPDDYNPPARLAAAYRELGQYDKAIAASDRALARVYGPRRLDVLGSRAHIQSSAGDKEAAKATLTQAIAEGEKLPEGHRSERQLARLRKFLEMLSAPAPS
jgi:tetratricopeptide (TPR) repeat protein